MTERRRPFRPEADLVEPRLLLSAAHHPIPYVGTIRGEFVVTATKILGNSFSNVEIVHASGTITPFGRVEVVSGRVVDSYFHQGSGSNADFVDRSIVFGLKVRGKVAVDVDLADPSILSPSPVEARDYPASFRGHGRPGTLGIRFAALTLPDGPPYAKGQAEPFAITFALNGIA